MNRPRHPLIVILVTLGAAALVIIRHFLGLGCPIAEALGIPCPTCGMTRALVCALQLNFLKSFDYYLFWPVVIFILVIYILKVLKKISINNKTMLLILYIFCFVDLIYYFYRLFNGSDIVYFDFYESQLYRFINMF